MARPRAAWIACLLVAAAAATGAAAEHGRPAFAPGVVLVRFKPTAGGRRLMASGADELGLEVKDVVGEYHALSESGRVGAAAASLPGAVMHCAIKDGSSVEAKVEQLKAHPEVDIAEPDFVRKLGGSRRMPMDPLYSAPHTQQHLDLVSAPLAWLSTTGSKDVGVCVIDSGLRATHEDVNDGRVIKGWNRRCPTCNAAFNGDKPKIGTPEYSNFTDFVGHGTHVATTIGGAANNRRGVAGVAWSVSLFICAAGSPDGMLYTSSLLDCYALCGAEAKVKVISNSYFSDCEGNNAPCYSQLEYEAIAKLSHTLFVVSAGNDNANTDWLRKGERSYPASYELPHIVTVAATMSDDSITPYSNYGRKYVDLAAPGTVRAGFYRSDDDYETLTGTSMACPIVSGAAVLLWSAKPTATPLEIKQALMASVDKSAKLKEYVGSGGRLNIAQALLELLKVGRKAKRMTYKHVVEQDTTYGLSIDRDTLWDSVNFAVLKTRSWKECQDKCLAQKYCQVFLAGPTATSLSLRVPTGDGLSVNYRGSCILVDSGFVLSKQKRRGFRAGYKVPQQPKQLY